MESGNAGRAKQFPYLGTVHELLLRSPNGERDRTNGQVENLDLKYVLDMYLIWIYLASCQHNIRLLTKLTKTQETVKEGDCMDFNASLVLFNLSDGRGKPDIPSSHTFLFSGYAGSADQLSG